MPAITLRVSPDAECFHLNHTGASELYALSLHDALPIYHLQVVLVHRAELDDGDPHAAEVRVAAPRFAGRHRPRSEEHTSELQSHSDLVCRLLLEKKNKLSESTADIQTHDAHSQW